MANPEHLAELKKGVIAWNHWRIANPDVEPDFSGVDFSSREVVGEALWNEHHERVNLDGVDLEGADLNGATLIRANLNNAHLVQANLVAANLRQATIADANLTKASLTGACLVEANLNGADLSEAVVREADLTKATIGGAVLHNADLRETNLGQAKFDTADMTDALLIGANLRKADLKGSVGLVAAQLRGADVTGALLPEDVAGFTMLDHVTNVSKQGRNVFLSMLVVCVISWLTIFAVKDGGLLTGSAITPVPLIQAKVPVRGFFYLVPALLVILYIYFHLHLQDFAKGVSTLPAVFQDGVPLNQRAHPWIFMSLVSRFVPALKRHRGSYGWIRVWFAVASAWALVPVTLFLFWMRSIPIRDWWLTGYLIVPAAIAVAFGIDSYCLAKEALSGKDTANIIADTKGDARLYTVASPTRVQVAVFWAAVVVLICIGLSWVAIEDIPKTWRENRILSRAIPDLRNAQLSVKTEDYYRHSALRKAASQPPKSGNDKNTGPSQQRYFPQTRREYLPVIGANLQGANLRHAKAAGAFLARANLKNADLQEASLDLADLRQADLSRANLKHATLEEANLEETTLRWAKLHRANLRRAKLQGAYLHWAKLQEAMLNEANLQGADLPHADLQGADLKRAKLQGADLDWVNLQGAGLLGADLRRATLVLSDLQRAELAEVNLQRASLPYAKLQNANLERADLQRANLQGVNFQGAEFLRPKLPNYKALWASLKDADLRKADLTGAKVSREQLEQACGDETTILPEHIKKLKDFEFKGCPKKKEESKGEY